MVFIVLLSVFLGIEVIAHVPSRLAYATDEWGKRDSRSGDHRFYHCDGKRRER